MTALPTPSGDGSILLIDDDEFIAGSFRDYLLRRGWVVDVAVEATAAEELMVKRQYAVIVVDPYFTGSMHAGSDTLLATIRVRQPRSSIIVLTGYGAAGLLETASADASTTLLFKPQSVTSLSDLIERMPISSTE